MGWWKKKQTVEKDREMLLTHGWGHASSTPVTPQRVAQHGSTVVVGGW
eukprot:gene7315-5155_t